MESDCAIAKLLIGVLRDDTHGFVVLQPESVPSASKFRDRVDVVKAPPQLLSCLPVATLLRHLLDVTLLAEVRSLPSIIELARTIVRTQANVEATPN